MTKFVSAKGMGFLMEREVKFLGKLLGDVERPFIAIIGGAKVSDKIAVLENLLGRVNQLLIGGAMAKLGDDLRHLNPPPRRSRSLVARNVPGRQQAQVIEFIDSRFGLHRERAYWATHPLEGSLLKIRPQLVEKP